MPQKAWSYKRERQYEHIKESYRDEGVSTDEAEERAARTVNKTRAEKGETESSRTRSRRIGHGRKAVVASARRTAGLALVWVAGLGQVA